MQMRAFGATDVGCVREHNEDAFLVDPALGLYVVCDGMGGHASGEVASNTAVSAVAEYVAEQHAVTPFSDDDDGIRAAAEVLYRAALHASTRVFELAQDDEDKHGMGTTLVALLTVGNRGVMVNVGDSRLYLVRGAQLAQLSTDHTYVNEAVSAGVLSEAQAKASPHAHVLTRAVGTQASVRADVMAFDILPGDTFLLCSDGLHEYTHEPRSLHETLSVDDVEEATATLVARAREAGGRDNITAVVVRATPSEQGDTARRDSVVHELDVLGEIDLFRDLSTPERVRLHGSLARTEVAPGQELMTEGEPSDRLFVVIDGELDVTRGGVPIARVGRGAHLGELSLLSERSRSASVTARTPCTLLALDRARFEDLLAHDPRIASACLLALARALSLRVDDAYLARDFRRGARTEAVADLPPSDDGP